MSFFLELIGNNSMKEKLFIRADASVIIGSGHFARCLNLARPLIKRGAEVTFLSRDLDEVFQLQLIAANCKLIKLPSPGAALRQKTDDYATWLGACEYDDISQCINLISGSADCSIIVDHYGVNEEWLGKAKKAFRKLIVVDDLADRKLDVDLVINQNLGWAAKDYAHLVGQETKLLLGPKYALLAENYSIARQKLDRSFKSEAPLRVLVSLGGVDIENVTGKVTQVLEEMQTKFGFVVTIVVGPMNPNSKELNAISQRSGGKIVLLQGANNLADAYLSHDIAIGAVGGSSWERCCLGLPTILVPIAENQKSAAKMLKKVGAGFLLDCLDNNFENELTKALRQMSDKETRSAMSKQAMRICDGLGATRVADEIMFG